MVVHLPAPMTLGRRGAVGDGIPDLLQSITSSTSSSCVVQVGTLPKFLDQWRSITSNKFVLNMVKGHHLQLKHHPLSFYNLKQFNSGAASAPSLFYTFCSQINLTSGGFAILAGQGP